MPDFPSVGGDTAATIWAYADRELTALTGQPRTDLVGADNAIWANATRSLTDKAGFTLASLTGQPRTDLLGDDHAFASATSTRIANLDRVANIEAFEAITEASTAMDGSEIILIEKTDNLQSDLVGMIDLTAMAGGDTIVVKEYMVLKNGGSYINYATQTYSGAQTPALVFITPKWSKRKIKVTAQQTAGSNRTLDNTWSRKSQASAT